MIRAGNYTIQDSGFATSMGQIAGQQRQTLVLELNGGIDSETLEALCAGPIEVLDEQGNVQQTHEGPFRVVTHSLKLTRTSHSADVSALTARVASLEAELSVTKSAKESAQAEFASLSVRFNELMATVSASKSTDETEDAGLTIKEPVAVSGEKLEASDGEVSV